MPHECATNAGTISLKRLLQSVEAEDRVFFYDGDSTICGVRIAVTSSIAFEIDLSIPAKWNQRFLALGNYESVCIIN